eukprot:scaffold53658_cov23-Tisochrysis_lutea.AAC.1
MGSLRGWGGENIAQSRESLPGPQTPSCHCSPRPTPCTLGPPHLTGIPRRHAEHVPIPRLWPDIMLVRFPCLHNFRLPDALMRDHTPVLGPTFCPPIPSLNYYACSNVLGHSVLFLYMSSVAYIAWLTGLEASHSDSHACPVAPKAGGAKGCLSRGEGAQHQGSPDSCHVPPFLCL